MNNGPKRNAAVKGSPNTTGKISFGESIKGVASFVFVPTHHAMELLNGMDLIFTLPRIGLILAEGLGWSVAGILGGAVIPMLVLGLVAGLLYLGIKVWKEKKRNEFTSEKKVKEDVLKILGLQQSVIPGTVSSIDQVFRDLLTDVANDLYGIEGSKRSDTKVTSKDGQIRINIPSLAPEEPSLIQKILTGLSNYSNYYWVIWFATCAIIGTMLAAPVWWIIVGALVAQWVLPFIVDKITNIWIPSTTNDDKFQKRLAERVIAFLKKPENLQYYLNKSQASPFFVAKKNGVAAGIIEEPPEIKYFTDEKQRDHKIYRGLSMATSFVENWLGFVGLSWPITEIIEYGMILAGVASPIITLIGLAFTVLIFAAGLAKGIIGMIGEYKKANKELAEDIRLANYKFEQFRSFTQEQNVASKVTNQNTDLKSLPTVEGQKAAAQPLFKIAEIGKVVVGGFGTGLGITRSLLLPGTIGAILSFGFTEFAAKGIVLGGVLGGPIAWLTIGIITLSIAVIFGGIKLARHHYYHKKLDMRIKRDNLVSEEIYKEIHKPARLVASPGEQPIAAPNPNPNPKLKAKLTIIKSLPSSPFDGENLFSLINIPQKLMQLILKIFNKFFTKL